MITIANKKLAGVSLNCYFIIL